MIDELIASAIIFLHSIEITWLINIERRLSRLEGYLKKIYNNNE